MRQRFLTFIVFGAILVAIGEWNLRTGRLAPLEWLNDFWLEFCVGNAGDALDDPAVTVVRIDDDYEPLEIGDSGAPADGKLSRLDYATILGFVSKLDPKSVAFLPTPTFDEKLVLNQTDIVPLKDAAMKLPRMVVATRVSNDGEQAKESEPLDYPALGVKGEPEEILAFTRTVRRPDPQLLANADPAFKTIESARGLADGGQLRVPLVANYRDKLVPSVILLSVADHAGVAPEDIVVDLSGRRAKIRMGDQRTIPVARDGTMVVPPHAGVRRTMTGTRHTEEGEQEKVYHFTSLTVDELAYTGEKDDEVARSILANFQGKFDSIARNLVVIGFDRSTDRRFTTANGEPLSETLLFSRAMATIQSGRFIEWWPTWARWLAVAVLVALAMSLFRFRRFAFLPVALVVGLIFFTAWVLIFRLTLTWTPPFVAFSLYALLLLVGLLIPGGPKKRKS